MIITLACFYLSKRNDNTPPRLLKHALIDHHTVPVQHNLKMFSSRKLLHHARRIQHQAQSFKHTAAQPVSMSYSYVEAPGAAAPPLIIMHGLFGSKANWNSLCKAFVRQLKPQRNVVAVDARNHGDSPHSHTHTYSDLVEDIRFLMGELGFDRASLLGHSMGGRAVMLCALKYVSGTDMFAAKY